MIKNLAFLLLLCALAAFVQAKELYTDKHDAFIDVDAILADDKSRKEHIACLVSKGPCPSEAAAFYKAIFPEAFFSNCSKCTRKQKYALKQFLKYLQTDPKAWAEVFSVFG